MSSRLTDVESRGGRWTVCPTTGGAIGRIIGDGGWCVDVVDVADEREAPGVALARRWELSTSP
jgi:hypothetical protein